MIRRALKALFSLLMPSMGVRASTRYEVECWRPDGTLRWKDGFDNIVVTAGLDALLDATLKTGLASPAWYVGLKGTGTPDAADTLASHATWSEINPYTGDRPAFTPGTISAGSVSNSASKASYTITDDLSVYGAFLASAASGTSGTLYGVGDFTAPRAVLTDDTLNVTVTPSIAAA